MLVKKQESRHRWHFDQGHKLSICKDFILIIFISSYINKPDVGYIYIYIYIRLTFDDEGGFLHISLPISNCYFFLLSVLL